MRTLLITIILFFITYQASSQISITESVNGKTLGQFIAETEESHKIDFIVENAELLNALTINGITETMQLGDFLEIFLSPLGLVPVKLESNVYIFITKAQFSLFGSRRDNYILIKSPEDQKTANIRGTIKDVSDQPIIGAQIEVPEFSKGAISSLDGTFSFTIEKGIHTIRGRFIGFDSTSYILGFSPLTGQTSIDMVLLPKSIHLQGVTITAKGSDNNIKSEISGISSMSIEAIKELPSFMGETDVIRSLTTFPGISTAGELSSGFNVRGGDVGQNLILQDEAIIFNPTHLFGFFSAFNPDIVNNVDLYKGGGPANYGGRTSSVLNVNLRNGDAGKFAANGGIGLISSRLTLEGPIKKSKSSFIIGGRISYVNWMIKALNNVKLLNSKANFGDLTAKLFFTINEKNFLSVTGYTSYDNFTLSSDSTFSWGTKNINVAWDHIFTERLSSTLNISNSNYSSAVENSDPINGFTYVNSINNLRMNYDLQYVISDKLNSSFGFDIHKRNIEPGMLEPSDLGENTEAVNINNQFSTEAALYFQNNIDITPKLAFSAGIRFSSFWRYGKDQTFVYDYSEMNGRYPSVADTLSYDKGEVISNFNGWEPRISLRYSITDNFSLKGSFYRTYQYLHLISNTVSTTPQDYWISSGPYLKPQKADQWSFGLFKNFNNDKLEFSVEGFYKDIYNAVDYIEGADITLNETMDAGLIQGTGYAYGLEFFAKKKYGKLDGWISYTYSRSLRKFDSNLDIKTINSGKYYPSVYDQPHSLSLVANYKLGPYVTLSTNFSYSSGRPITIPISQVSYEHYLSVLSYSERNEYRIPDYHRLDLSISFKDRPRQGKKIYGEWIFGVFNVYGRKNPYSVFFSPKGSAYKMSILGTVLPSLTYNFKI